jgi:hypothetical protein
MAMKSRKVKRGGRESGVERREKNRGERNTEGR